jgi:WD40 repeat protein
VYSGSNDDRILVWDATSGEVLSEIAIGPEDEERYTSAVTFHPDNNFALTGHTDGTVVLWDVASGQRMTQYTHNTDGTGSRDGEITALAFRPDGLAATVGARDGTLFEVRNTTLRELVAWTRANRYIPALSCDEQQAFNIPCEDEDEAEASPTPTNF